MQAARSIRLRIASTSDNPATIRKRVQHRVGRRTSVLAVVDTQKNTATATTWFSECVTVIERSSDSRGSHSGPAPSHVRASWLAMGTPTGANRPNGVSGQVRGIPSLSNNVIAAIAYGIRTFGDIRWLRGGYWCRGSI